MGTHQRKPNWKHIFPDVWCVCRNSLQMLRNFSRRSWTASYWKPEELSVLTPHGLFPEVSCRPFHLAEKTFFTVLGTSVTRTTTCRLVSIALPRRAMISFSLKTMSAPNQLELSLGSANRPRRYYCSRTENCASCHQLSRASHLP